MHIIPSPLEMVGEIGLGFWKGDAELRALLRDNFETLGGRDGYYAFVRKALARAAEELKKNKERKGDR